MFRIIFAVIVLCKTNVLAHKINEKNIEVHFYSPENNDPNKNIPLNRSELIAPNLNLTSDVKVIIHGYTLNAKYPLVTKLIDTYLKTGEHNNIIVFDWSRYGLNEKGSILGAALSYFDVFSAKDNIAEIMANDLISFSKVNKIPLSKFHILGLWFGGQLAGIIGQKVFNKTNEKLPRITGIDPAGPLFLGAHENSRLDPSDATFVDVIHTYLFTGYFRPCGTVDFWPNGGKLQKGCDVFTICNQVRALEYYIESINSKNFAAWECFDEHLFNRGICEEGDVIVMGEHVNTSATGQYFLHTNPKSPYACIC